MREEKIDRKDAKMTAGMKDDLDAVRNAIVHGISNGPVEGMSSRLKAIKRSMHVRASYRLLMIKMLRAWTG